MVNQQIDINEVIENVLEFFMLNPLYKYQVEKHTNLSDNLKNISGNLIQIKQIVDNLVKNAIDAMEKFPVKKQAHAHCNIN